jgi:hypothetical protein
MYVCMYVCMYVYVCVSTSVSEMYDDKIRQKSNLTKNSVPNVIRTMHDNIIMTMIHGDRDKYIPYELALDQTDDVIK